MSGLFIWLLFDGQLAAGATFMVARLYIKTTG